MRIKILLTIILLLNILLSIAQSTDSSFFSSRNIEELGLFGGYNFNFGSDNKNLHVVELGIKRTYDIGTIEPFCKSIYFSNEFLFTDKKFMIGPKVGANMTIMAITLGLETIYYTDFTGQSIKLSPYFGFGSNRGRITFNFPLNLYKKDFDYINPATLHFSFQYLILWNKKHKEIK